MLHQAYGPMVDLWGGRFLVSEVPQPLGGVRGFRWPQILGCCVTKFVSHKALRLIACDKSTFDERGVLTGSTPGIRAHTPLTPNTVELIPTLGALFSRGGPVPDPVLTRAPPCGQAKKDLGYVPLKTFEVGMAEVRPPTLRVHNAKSPPTPKVNNAKSLAIPKEENPKSRHFLAPAMTFAIGELAGARCPHCGVRPFHQKSTCIAQ
jgi:hypothetical protein